MPTPEENLIEYKKISFNKLEMFKFFGVDKETSVDIMSGIIEGVEDLLKEEMENHDELRKKSILNSDSMHKLFLDEWLEKSSQKLKTLRYKHLSYRYIKDRLTGKRRASSKRKEWNLEEIKRIPIETMMPYAPSVRSGNRLTYKCPFQAKDNHPSFVVYVDQNTWYCYSCSKGGSNLDLKMGLDNVDFNKAVDSLSQII